MITHLYEIQPNRSPTAATNPANATRSLIYAYDSEDRLLSKDVWYAGQGMQSATESEQYVYEGSDRQFTRDLTGKVTHRYQYGPMSPAPIVDEAFAANGTLASSSWAFSDELGTVRDVVNAFTGGVENHLDYDEHGAIRQVAKVVGGAKQTITSSARAIDAAFAGQFFDDDLKLAIHGARWYDPAAEVFISEDPANADANLYRYASNDPVNFVDPSGLATQSPLEYLPAFGAGSGNVAQPQLPTFGLGNINSLINPTTSFANSSPWSGGSTASTSGLGNLSLFPSRGGGGYTGPTILGSGVTLASANNNNANWRPANNTTIVGGGLPPSTFPQMIAGLQPPIFTQPTAPVDNRSLRTRANEGVDQFVANGSWNTGYSIFDVALPPSKESTFGARIQTSGRNRRRAFDATRSEVQSGGDHREAA